MLKKLLNEILTLMGRVPPPPPMKANFMSAPMPAKDPKDWTLTRNSTGWMADQYCPTCKKSTNHNERMSHICNGCGTYDKALLFRTRSFRKIWNGQKWVYQFKYPQNEVYDQFGKLEKLNMDTVIVDSDEEMEAIFR